jgi:hypothetical protein
MKKFVPNYIFYIIQLLDKYYKFVDTHEVTDIVVLPTILERIENLSHKFQKLLSREDLTKPDQLKRNLRSFQTLLLELEELECFGLPIVTHYRRDFDGYLSSILNQLGSEISCPVEQPHVCTLSTGISGQGRDYYWYHNFFDTIFVPSAEKFSLLNLPDLLHELGHHIFKIYRDSFLEPFPSWLSECNDDLEKMLYVEDIRDENRINECKNIFRNFWPNSWSEELTCDLIAVYCSGKAYAWTNLKLCQSYHPDYEWNNIYHFTDFHPPDSYRMDAILAMLRWLKIEIHDVCHTWMEYTEFFRHTKPPLYENLCPDQLVEKMVQHVARVCDDIGLVPCPANLNNPTTIVSKLNRAWSLFHSNPKNLQKMENDFS